MSIYSDQKTVKPKIEDAASEYICDDKLRGLMDFLGFLHENKLMVRWASWNSWKVSYKGKSMCFIKIDENRVHGVDGMSWLLMLSVFTREKWFLEYDDYFANNELKEFIWENVRGSWCSRDCKGHTKTVLGKSFNDFCGCWGIRVENPDDVALERSKKVVLTIKNYITDLVATSKSLH